MRTASLVGLDDCTDWALVYLALCFHPTISHLRKKAILTYHANLDYLVQSNDSGIEFEAIEKQEIGSG